MSKAIKESKKIIIPDIRPATKEELTTFIKQKFNLVDEEIQIEIKDPDFDDFVFIFADDGLFGDQVGNIVSDCLTNFLPVALTGGSAPVRP